MNQVQMVKQDEVHREKNHRVGAEFVFVAIPLACRLVKNFGPELLVQLLRDGRHTQLAYSQMRVR